MNKVKLGEVATECRETYRGDKSGIPIVGLEHLIPENIELSQWSVDSENTFTKSFKAGQVLFGRRRAYLKKAAVAPVDGICSGDITVIDSKPEYLSQRLLPFIIQNDDFFDYAVGKSAGSLSPRVKWEHLKNYEFNLPDMDEQNKLADVLWAIEEAKRSYKKLLIKTDELVKSQFIEMFGNPIKNERNWRVLPLKEILEPGRTVTYGIVKTGDELEEGVPVFRPVDITNGHLPTRSELKCTTEEISEQYKRTILNGTELLITVRGSIGETFQVTSEFAGCNVGRNIVPFRFNHNLVGNKFMDILFHQDAIKNYLASITKGIALQGINMGEFKEMPVILPSIELQREIEHLCEQSDKSKYMLHNMTRRSSYVYRR